VLSDIFDPARYRTITVTDAVKQGLLEPSWEDFATKLYLNDRYPLYVLMSREEPVLYGLTRPSGEGLRDQHNDKAGRQVHLHARPLDLKFICGQFPAKPVSDRETEHKG